MTQGTCSSQILTRTASNPSGGLVERCRSEAQPPWEVFELHTASHSEQRSLSDCSNVSTLQPAWKFYRTRSVGLANKHNARRGTSQPQSALRGQFSGTMSTKRVLKAAHKAAHTQRQPVWVTRHPNCAASHSKTFQTGPRRRQHDGGALDT